MLKRKCACAYLSIAVRLASTKINPIRLRAQKPSFVWGCGCFEGSFQGRRMKWNSKRTKAQAPLSLYVGPSMSCRSSGNHRKKTTDLAKSQIPSAVHQLHILHFHSRFHHLPTTLRLRLCFSPSLDYVRFFGKLLNFFPKYENLPSTVESHVHNDWKPETKIL